MDSPRIDAAVRTGIDDAVLCWLATVDADGTPNVSPKEIFAALDEHRLVIADIASPQSLRNIRAHAPVCVSFVDVFRQRGYKLTGHAVLVSPGDAGFAEVATPLLRLAGEAFPVRHAIVVTVTRVARIVAPSYVLFPDRSEADRVAEAHRAYGVMPLQRGGQP